MVEVRGRWRIESLGGTDAVGEPEPTFEADGSVTGRPGVNRPRATYTLDGDELTCSPFALTRMAGPPELMAQEQAVVTALAGPVPVSADGDRLVIGTGDGRLVLAPA